MFFSSRQKREQQARNRAKARSLIDSYGDGALDFVQQQLAATTWEIRNHGHWLRVEKHVRRMLGRR